jgi:GGDEF domain-containing protein
MIETIGKLIEINNQFYPDLPLSLSIGAATQRPGERLEAVIKRADLRMLDAKREHYSTAHNDRRRASLVPSG